MGLFDTLKNAAVDLFGDDKPPRHYEIRDVVITDEMQQAKIAQASERLQDDSWREHLQPMFGDDEQAMREYLEEWESDELQTYWIDGEQTTEEYYYEDMQLSDEHYQPVFTRGMDI